MSDDQAQADPGVAASGSSGAAAVVREQLEHLGPWRAQAGLEALDALLEDRDEWREYAEKMARCDCVPAMLSSRACPKCGRHGVVFDSWEQSFQDALARVGRLEEALRPFLAYPRWLSIGSVNNTAEIRVSRAAFERAAAALVRTGEEHGQEQEREAPQAVPVAEAPGLSGGSE